MCPPAGRGPKTTGRHDEPARQLANSPKEADNGM